MADAETIIVAALASMTGVGVFPDVAPGVGTPQNPGAPWIVYTAVGGQAYPTLDGSAASLRNSRMSLTVYATTRKQANSLLEQAFQLLVNPTVKAVPIGGPTNSFESDTLLYSRALDFSITYNT